MREVKDVKLGVKVDGSNVYNGSKVSYEEIDNKIIIHTTIGKTKLQQLEITLTHLPEATIIK